ncbi:MAG: hypothetical protein BGO78_08650 [Chloroflexi bacterium 44-23]|nr:MAG: hypothetical protein BGO78_08650 [Chloroflexi bacterium 44-23]
MRRFLLTCLLLFSFAVSPVNAQTDQTDQTIDQLIVKIWPEYDEPSVLVIQDIFLSPQVKLPASISIRIPAAAGAPHSVAVRELDGQLYVLDYDSKVSGDWNTLTFTTPYTEIWVEYYDPSIVKNGDERSFAFRWAGDLTVNNFNLEVQKPRTAESMSFKEKMGPGALAGDGLTYFTSSLGLVPAGTPFTLNINYIKKDDVLTNSTSQAVQPSQPLTDQTPGRLPFSELLPYLLGGLGLLLLIGGGFFYLQSRKNPIGLRVNQKQSARKRHATVSFEGEVIYCHKCGKRADKGDVFCRVCGTRLKIE